MCNSICYDMSNIKEEWRYSGLLDHHVVAMQKMKVAGKRRAV